MEKACCRVGRNSGGETQGTWYLPLWGQVTPTHYQSFPANSSLTRSLPPTEINLLVPGLAEEQGAEYFPLDQLVMLWRAAEMGRRGDVGEDGADLS